MILTCSSHSNSSLPSNSSGMSSDGCPAASPNTAFSSYVDNDSSYQDDYTYSNARTSYYGDVNTGTFPQYTMNHLAFSNPNGLLPDNQWTPHHQNLTTHYIPQTSYRDDHMSTTYQPSSDNIRHTIKSLGWDKDTRYIEGNRLYNFILNKGRNPYYELISPENASPLTPLQVYLAHPL